MTGLSVEWVDGNKIQKGATVNSGNLSQLTNHWYVTAGEGDVVVRVFPGMWLGETETGELSLEGSDALLSLSIGRGNLLVVFAVDGGELDSEDEEFRGRRHLAFESAAQIKLPNNILRFDRDIVSETGSSAPEQPRAVWRKAVVERPLPATASIDTTPAPSEPELRAPAEPEKAEPETNGAASKAPQSRASEPSVSQRHGSQKTAVTKKRPNVAKVPAKIPAKVPAKPSNSDKKRQRAIVATASAGLVCALIGLGYAVTRTEVTPEQPTPVAQQVTVEEATVEAVGEANRETAVLGVVNDAPLTETPNLALSGRDQRPDAGKSLPAQPDTPATEVPARAVASTNPTNEPIADEATLTAVEAVVETETVAEAVAVDTAKPAPQNRPRPQVAERAAPSNTTRTPNNTASQQTNRNPVVRREVTRAAPVTPKAEVEAEVAMAEVATQAQLRREQEQAQAALMRYERDLLAAELAMAQGRLTQPPESSAYTLYKQLVASNPESSEARRGFQALGAALVNRAFAELAAKRWSDARDTLAAAAEAGASPALVADLSGEVAYQQYLADAEAGRFASLYPETDLVALNRTTPRLRRYAPDDIKMVQIEFTISIAGDVQDIEVLGAPPQRLERAVRQAVTDWRFEPVLSGTRPIPVRTRVGLDIP